MGLIMTEKNKGGRPTKYKEEYCGKAKEFLGRGKSVTQLAAELKVNLDTVYEWAKVHPLFSEALTEGKQLAQAYWEGELVNMMYSKEVNSPLVKLYFANRFGWSDKAETKVESKTATVDESKLSW